MIKVNAVSLDETKYFTISKEDQQCIKEIHSVYCFDPETRTHLCEATPSYYLLYLYSYIVLQDESYSDKLEELENKYCHEVGEDIYVRCSDVRNYPFIKECGEFESLEDGREHLQGNCPF